MYSAIFIIPFVSLYRLNDQARQLFTMPQPTRVVEEAYRERDCMAGFLPWAQMWTTKIM